MTLKTLMSFIAAITMITTNISVFSVATNAAIVTDGHGNVGYDSYDECVLAVQNGSAKFYQPYTYQLPKLMATETAVKQMTLAQVVIPQSVVNRLGFNTNNYQLGSCDLGMGRAHGRYGVSAALIGKYVPFSPNLPINVYLNHQRNPVRITMQQCDNHFADNFPIPIMPLSTSNTLNTTQAPTVIEQKRHISYVKPVNQTTQADDTEAIQLGIPIMNTINHTQAQAITAQEQPNTQSITTSEVRHIRIPSSISSNTINDIPEMKTDSQNLPIIRTTDYNGKLPVYNPKTGQYDLID